MATCKSGRHTWTDEASAARCCNGWHQELKLDGPEPGDEPEGRVYVSHFPTRPRAAYVWVKDEEQADCFAVTNE
jgi:hypothetical protein